MMNFGENFKNIRKQCGLSQQEVADKLQIKQSSVSKIMHQLIGILGA